MNPALDNLATVARRWLGDEYDLEALHAVVAAAAVEQLQGDPVWLLVVSGSGNAKTETVQALAGVGALITSTISSPGALLSGTSAKERSTDATGGLLRKMGDRGIVVVKDFTSILSMGREMRGEVLGALREVYDGRWSRNVGTDGGRTLDWVGRLVIIGAVTTAWDRAHGVVAAMGDRFVLVRMDSSVGREAAGRRAIGNTGSEAQMRDELAEAVTAVLDGMDTNPIDLSDDETDQLLAAANLVTLARTAVEGDGRGEPEYAHAPEMPTRFAKQLAQIVHGAVAVGIDRGDAMRLAIRCARDSMPPIRLACIDDVSTHPGASTREVRARLDLPRTTVDRTLQALNLLGVLAVREDETPDNRTVWRYSLRSGINPTSIVVPGLSVGAYRAGQTVPDPVPGLSVGVHRSDGSTPVPSKGRGATDKSGANPSGGDGGLTSGDGAGFCRVCSQSLIFSKTGICSRVDDAHDTARLGGIAA